MHCDGRDELHRYGLNEVVHCPMCVSTLVGVIRVVNYASFVNRTMWMFTDIAGGCSRGLGFEGELVMHCSSCVSHMPLRSGGRVCETISDISVHCHHCSVGYDSRLCARGGSAMVANRAPVL